MKGTHNVKIYTEKLTKIQVDKDSGWQGFKLANLQVNELNG